MRQAGHCDDPDALQDVARTFSNSALAMPLPDAEIERAAKSAWKYEISGRNLFGRGGATILEHNAIDVLVTDTDALALYVVLCRHHAPGSEFILANAMASETVPAGPCAASTARIVVVKSGSSAYIPEAAALATRLGIVCRTGPGSRGCRCSAPGGGWRRCAPQCVRCHPLLDLGHVGGSMASTIEPTSVNGKRHIATVTARPEAARCPIGTATGPAQVQSFQQR